MLSLSRYFHYSPETVNYLVHVSQKHKLLYLEVPKAGCTIVKTALQYSELSSREWLLPANVHDRSLSPLKSLDGLGVRPGELFSPRSN